MSNNCGKNVVGMTRCFFLAKRLVKYFSQISCELVEHCAQSPDREVKMLVVWPSITEGFPTLPTISK